MKQPKQMVERKMMRWLVEEKDVDYRYRYRSHWLPDCILRPKLDGISRFRAPYSFRSHYLEVPTT